ncbi:CBS domain-containing protein [Streptosporangium sp. NPDC051023]|uniref:CBS domain-containing protein n=1 Tax=Streptosporangium sp. NPDC051023 TaxID=3155410 RepID=UPI00344BD1C5
MLVREVMTTDVVTVDPADPVRRAVRTLYEHGVTAAPVLDEHGHLVGVVSEMDLLRGEFERDPRSSARIVLGHAAPPPYRVADIMTTEVTTVTETTDITVAIDLMICKRIKSLPVTRDGRVVGVLSRRDLLALLARPDEDIHADVLEALREHYPSGPSWEVGVRDGIVELRGHHTERVDGIADLLARTVPGVVRVRHLR